MVVSDEGPLGRQDLVDSAHHLAGGQVRVQPVVPHLRNKLRNNNSHRAPQRAPSPDRVTDLSDVTSPDEPDYEIGDDDK